MKLHYLFALLLIVLTLTAGAFLAPVSAQTNACANEVTVASGDTLSRIATRFFGSSAAYTAIVNATNAQAITDRRFTAITNPNLLEVGWRLCIPASPALAAVPPSPTPTPGTPTPTPTPYPEDEHPLNIEEMRRQAYPGSTIVIEQTLAPGSNYSRYLASYQSEGNKIFALLTVPQGTAPATGWPVVVFNHGYIPPEQYRTTERYIAYVDAFARNGYIVFRSDYRGHGSSEGEAVGGYSTPAYTVDVLNAVASIKRFAGADPDRIGMWGHSMGGQITLRAMVVTDDIKAGVIWAGVVGSYPDLLDRWRRAPAYNTLSTNARRWREEIISTYGRPEENPDFWAAISPNSYVADLSGPIQLHHGTADGSVPVEFSQTLETQIKAANGDVESYLYAGDDHNIAQNLGTALARSVAFFDAHVKN